MAWICEILTEDAGPCWAAGALASAVEARVPHALLYEFLSRGGQVTRSLNIIVAGKTEHWEFNWADDKVSGLKREQTVYSEPQTAESGRAIQFFSKLEDQPGFKERLTVRLVESSFALNVITGDIRKNETKGYYDSWELQYLFRVTLK